MTNLFAGMGAHQSAKSETDVWLTPPAIIDALGGWENFDLDPSAQPDQAEVLPTARTYYSEEQNGLIMPWFGRVWLNAPYSLVLVTRFLGRMAEHDCGTALIFARTDTDAFHRFVYGAASGLLYLRGRLNFHRPDGSRAEANSGAPSVLIAYGETDCEILSVAPIDGHFEALRLKSQMLVQAFAVGSTWAEVLDGYMSRQNGPVALGELYRAFVDHPKSRANQHWRDKLRQVLQRGAYERVDKGVWRRRAA